MSGDELMTQFEHDHLDKDPVMESHTEKEETSMLNCFQKVQEEGGCDEPMDSSPLEKAEEPMDSDSLDKAEEPVDSDSLDKAEEPVDSDSLDKAEEPVDSDSLDKGDQPMDNGSLQKDDCPSPTKSVDDQREMQGTAESVCGATVDATSVLNDSTSTENSEDPNHNTAAVETQRAVEQSEPVSEKMVPSEEILDESSKSLSPGHVPELDQKPLTESECNSEASDAEAPTENPTDTELSSRGRPRKEKRVIKCEFCGRPFNHASAYIIHRRVHTGEKPFSCQICSRAFAQLSNLRSHMKVHNAPRILSMQQYNKLEKKIPVVKSVPQKEETVMPESRDESPSKSRSPSRRSRKPVACPICAKIFPYKSVLKIHMRIHSGEKPYACRVCGKAFTQACTVRVHERVHWSIKPFLCSKCGKGFSQIGTLKAHTCAGKPQVHSTLKEMELAGVVTFRCHLCKECFSTRDEYDPHLQSHTDNQRYSCERCGQKYGLRSELDTHLKYCFSMWLAKTKPFNRLASARLHMKPAPTNKTVQSSQAENAPDSPVKSPISPTSPILSSPKTSFKPPQAYSSQHIYSFQQQKRKKYLSLLTCPTRVIATSIYDPENNVSYCQPFKTSYFVSQLNSLDQKADPRKYLCPRCGRLFRHVGRLRAHMLTHSRGKSFTCGECGRISEDWSTFWRHQRVHKQRRGRFFCPTCGQGFRFASNYMEHLQEHPELNAYFCPFCPQTFADAKSLKNHQQEWHRSNMPHVCDICGKGFQSPVVLKRHRVGHCFQDRQTDAPYVVDVQPAVKPYECGKCSASFKTLDRLFSHQLCHSTEKDFRLSLSNGIINGHKDMREEKQQQNSAQKDYKSNHHVRASTSESNTSDSCQDIASGSPASPPAVPNGSDGTKTQPQQDIDTSVSQSTATLPLSSSDSESIPAEVEEAKKPVFTYERTKEIKESAETDQTIGDETAQSKPERKAGHLECTECGAWFALLPALHRHYLEHAWGQF